MTFTDVHTGRQKVPKSDFQSHFSMSKNVRIFLKKNFIEEHQFRTTFFVKYIFWWLQNWTTFVCKMTSNFWRSVWTSVSNQKNIFILPIFFAKICSLLTHVRKTPSLRSHYHVQRGYREVVCFEYFVVTIPVWIKWLNLEGKMNLTSFYTI